MRILKIELFNIGSYEGLNKITINNNKEKNVILVGGKNGAGKTTLFESIKLCLYGYKESGYQIMNSLYKKRIKSLINDYAKLQSKTYAYVYIEIEIFNGQDNDIYYLKRKWDLTTEVFENFTVIKNGIELNELEIEEFNNYLLDLIPPELFNLYFFDGEQIADDFLSDSGNEKIKQSFLVLCGYDTFNIMLQNFKRISYNKKETNNSAEQYLKSKELYDSIKEHQKESHNKIDNAYSELEQISSDIGSLELEYKKNGGISQEEWNNKINEIDNEEKKRDELNADIKRLANDTIPFIILENEIKEVIKQINKEDDYIKRKNIYQEINNILPKVVNKTLNNFDKNNKTLTDYSQQITKNLLDSVKVKPIETILNLSLSEKNQILNIVNNKTIFEKDLVINNRLAVKNSLKKAKELKQELDNCNINNVQFFLNQKKVLTEKKEYILNNLQQYLDEKTQIDEEFIIISEQYKHDSKILEEELKNNSIVDISSKSILFLESLQNELLKNKIKEVETLFINKLNELKRKETFIDKIIIDEDFYIHVYKRIIIKCKIICEKIKSIGIERYKNENGIHHCNDILTITKTKTFEEFINKYEDSDEVFDVMHEFEKQKMSKGEKQIFIMALYWALMSLSKKDIPFMMDTPFARIDKEHRSKITEKFFSQLPGQVFIFSTDEEIVNEHYKQLENKINKTFLLENKNNNKTEIIENKYF